MDQLSRVLIVLGAVFIIAGLVFHFGLKLGLGKLPGDIVFERNGFKLFIPITTSLIISIFLTILLNLFFRR